MGIKHYKVAIIGGGPAGLTAALYLGRAQVDTLVIDADMCGGQVISSPLLENVPGYYGSGAELAIKMLDEVQKYPSVSFENFNKVLEVHPSYSYNKLNGYILKLEDGTIVTSDYIICATGSQPIHLPNTDQPNTHYCVTCDGALYQDKVVAVIGGGNSALQYALELTKYAAGVLVVTNEDELRGEQNMRERVLEHEKIEVYTNSAVESFDGRYLYIDDGSKICVEGIFVAVGYRTNTDYLNGYKHNGRFIVNKEFNVQEKELVPFEHAYAIGDCRSKPFNQVVIAMADGCEVALRIISDLEK